MAEQPPHPKIVLQVNINCCLACPKKLEKALLKLKGVSSFAINKEENCVSVEGTVDPDKIIKLIYSKVSKRAKLISYTPPAPPPAKKKDETPKKTNPADDNKDSNNKSKSKNTNPADDNKDSNNKSKHKDEEKNAHKRCVYQDGNYPKMANNEHICEEYDPSPKVQDVVRRDYFCRQHHTRSQNLTDMVPEDERAYMQNYEQGYYGGPSTQYPIRGLYYCPPPGYRYPGRPPAHYGYYHDHPYGYY